MLEASDEPVQPAHALPQIEITSTPAIDRQRSPAAPPLGVVHLLLWMACCALYLGIMRRQFDVEPGALGLVMLAAFGLSTSLAWTGLAIFATRRLRGARWPIEPGEWLLAALGLQFTLAWLIRLVDSRLITSQQSVVEAVICCFLLLPLLGRPARPWTIVFALLITLMAMPLVVMALSLLGWIDVPRRGLWEGITLLRSAATIGIVPLAAAIDRRRHSWLHRLGLIVFVYDRIVRLVVELGF